QLANLSETVVSYRMHSAQNSMRKREQQVLCAVAARVSAQARRAGRADPFDAAESIDQDTLIALGVTPAEITAHFVTSTAWLAKTMGRAGYADAAERLFDAAAERARSSSGSLALVAHVHRERARRETEQGHRLRARLSRV